MKTCPNPACPDRIDLGAAGEYVDSVAVCPTCGTRLIAARPRDSSGADQGVSDARMSDLDMVSVLQTADESLVVFVKSLLDGENIKYVVKGEGIQDLLGLGRFGGFNYVVGPTEILVERDDADRARALLQSGAAANGALEPEDDC